MDFTHIDCFSGVGGFCTGLKAAGFHTLNAIEKVKSCVESYGKNHPEVNIIHSDIRKVQKSDLIGLDKPVDLVTSGMPCETFSTAGATSRSFYDDRQFLFQEGIRIAKMANARIILFENVPAILTKKVEKHGNRLIVDELFKDLDEAGYTNHIYTVLNSADFGVPQLRERFFVLASQENLSLSFPNGHQKEYVSVQEAIADLPKVEVNSMIEGIHYENRNNAYTKLMRDPDFWKLSHNNILTYHLPPNHRTGTLERFSYIKPGKGLKDLFMDLPKEKVEELQRKRVLPKKWYIQRNRRLQANLPSVTVTSHCIDELIHPFEDRSLTVREVARLQSFPDSYDFFGGPYICPHIYEEQDKYEQIGDAVPPLLAYALGKHIISILEDK
jgi:DNA (cytosine-5)-methyltransferase 1